MDSIVFSLSKVPDAITDKTVYTAHVQTNGTLGRDELAERLAARTKQDVSLWKYFLDALSDEIGIQLLAGYRINLGQLTTGFAIRGSFMSEDEAFDPARHQLVAVSISIVCDADSIHFVILTAKAVRSPLDFQWMNLAEADTFFSQQLCETVGIVSCVFHAKEHVFLVDFLLFKPFH